MSIYKDRFVPSAAEGRYPERPGFKARDTSRDAAEGVAPAAKSLRARVFDALAAHGPATPEEVAERLGEPVHNIRPRFSELAVKALIRDTGERREAMGGRKAIVWQVTRQGG